MDTPIIDFVKKYANGKHTRLHMPGHKGCLLLGMEDIDVTEFDGADCLYSANGIIKKSRENASALSVQTLSIRQKALRYVLEQCYTLR